MISYPGYQSLKIKNKRKIGKKRREKEEKCFFLSFFTFFFYSFGSGTQGNDFEDPNDTIH